MRTARKRHTSREEEENIALKGKGNLNRQKLKHEDGGVKPKKKDSKHERGFGKLLSLQVDGIPQKLGHFVVEKFDAVKMELCLKGGVVSQHCVTGDCDLACSGSRRAPVRDGRAGLLYVASFSCEDMSVDHSIPAIEFWTLDRLHQRQTLEIAGGGFGRGKFIGLSSVEGETNKINNEEELKKMETQISDVSQMLEMTYENKKLLHIKLEGLLKNNQHNVEIQELAATFENIFKEKVDIQKAHDSTELCINNNLNSDVGNSRSGKKDTIDEQIFDIGVELNAPGTTLKDKKHDAPSFSHGMTQEVVEVDTPKSSVPLSVAIALKNKKVDAPSFSLGMTQEFVEVDTPKSPVTIAGVALQIDVVIDVGSSPIPELRHEGKSQRVNASQPSFSLGMTQEDAQSLPIGQNIIQQQWFESLHQYKKCDKKMKNVRVEEEGKTSYDGNLDECDATRKTKRLKFVSRDSKSPFSQREVVIKNRYTREEKVVWNHMVEIKKPRKHKRSCGTWSCLWEATKKTFECGFKKDKTKQKNQIIALRKKYASRILLSNVNVQKKRALKEAGLK
ncbi:hypothetical protein E3N88_29578 [Mikania micrantha]|uniref:Uncharacterized protein n=1 Tax=Mikania micrantha TaxID=192012 RepID=A0A5N6MJ91_9ASTR|nr:hypothetical protein E3N88_29578 [Mikania micrantha]